VAVAMPRLEAKRLQWQHPNGGVNRQSPDSRAVGHGFSSAWGNKLDRTDLSGSEPRDRLPGDASTRCVPVMKAQNSLSFRQILR
jgi:hypothetical protein